MTKSKYDSYTKEELQDRINHYWELVFIACVDQDYKALKKYAFAMKYLYYYRDIKY